MGLSAISWIISVSSCLLLFAKEMNVQSVITVEYLDGRMENIIFNQLSFKEAFLLVNSNFQLESYGRIVGGGVVGFGLWMLSTFQCSV